MWSALIKNYIVFGKGRSVRNVTADRNVFEQLDKETEAFAHIETPDFRELLMATLATRDFFPVWPQVFESVQSLAFVLDAGNPFQRAMRVVNSISASSFAFDNEGNPQSTDVIASQILDGFTRGIFLHYPKDNGKLLQQAAQDMLPGTLVFQLHGSGRVRPVLRTWEREALAEERYQRERRT